MPNENHIPLTPLSQKRLNKPPPIIDTNACMLGLFQIPLAMVTRVAPPIGSLIYQMAILSLNRYPLSTPKMATLPPPVIVLPGFTRLTTCLFLIDYHFIERSCCYCNSPTTTITLCPLLRVLFCDVLKRPVTEYVTKVTSRHKLRPLLNCPTQ